MLTKEPILSAAFLCMVAALPGCSAASPAAGSAPAAAVPSARAAFAFTVAGARPVPPNGSQDTHAQTPKAGCDSATFAADKGLGIKVAGGFALAGFPASADLLTHFLKGKGTEVDYWAGSPISKQALSSSAFRTVNSEVQEAIISQLKAGKTRVQLSAAQTGSHTSLARPDNAGFLGFAAVFSSARGHGAGRALGETVLEWAAQAGFGCVVTDWRVTNLLSSRTWPALGFAESFLRLHRLIGY